MFETQNNRLGGEFHCLRFLIRRRTEQRDLEREGETTNKVVNKRTRHTDPWNCFNTGTHCGSTPIYQSILTHTGLFDKMLVSVVLSVFVINWKWDAPKSAGAPRIRCGTPLGQEQIGMQTATACPTIDWSHWRSQPSAGGKPRADGGDDYSIPMIITVNTISWRDIRLFQCFFFFEEAYKLCPSGFRTFHKLWATQLSVLALAVSAESHGLKVINENLEAKKNVAKPIVFHCPVNYQNSELVGFSPLAIFGHVFGWRFSPKKNGLT